MSIKPVSKVLMDKNRLSLDLPGVIHLKYQLIISVIISVSKCLKVQYYSFLPVMHLNLFPDLFKFSSLKVKHGLGGFISIVGRILVIFLNSRGSCSFLN